MDLKSNQKVVAHSHNIPATIVLVGMYCQAKLYGGFQGHLRGRTVDDLSPLVACLEPLSTVKEGQPVGTKFPGQHQHDFSMSYDLRRLCL